MRRARVLVLTAALGGLAACEQKPPPTPDPDPNGVETIRGTERLGWDQQADGAAALATFRYAIYVDGARSEIAGASCGSTAGASGFPCTGRLPSMTPGAHTLELAAFILDGDTVVESPRSVPLRVIVTASTSITTASTSGTLRSGQTILTADRVRLRVEIVAERLAEPTDLAFDPQGRLFVADRSGLVHVLDEARREHETTSIEDMAAEGYAALALDPDFDRTRFVYVVHTAIPRSGSPAAIWRLSRYREVAGRFAERAVLLDDVAARPDGPAAALRFGPDGKLYVALDDGGDPASVEDPSSLNGKVLRLNADGTTPDDQPSANPVHLAGYGSPRGLAFEPDGALWILDGARPHEERIVVAQQTPAPRRRAAVEGQFPLEPDTGASGAAFYRGAFIPAFTGDLLVAAETGRHLVRVRLDPRTRRRIVSIEKLLAGSVDALRAVAVRPDGAIYVATSDTIARLVPVR